MFPVDCVLDHYLNNMFNFVKRLDLESDSGLFNTKRVKARPVLYFNRYVLNSNYSIIPESHVKDYLKPVIAIQMNDLIKLQPELSQYSSVIINQALNQDVISKQVYYLVRNSKNVMVAGAGLFYYKLGNQQIIQLGDSMTTQIYFAVNDKLKKKNVGTDLLLAIINDSFNTKAKFYIIEPLNPMINLITKFGFKKDKNDNYLLDCSLDKNQEIKKLEEDLASRLI